MRSLAAAALAAAVASCLPGPAAAQDAPARAQEPPPAPGLEETMRDLGRKEEAAPAAEMPEVTVTATRTSRDPFELPMSVSLFGREDIEGPGTFVAMKAPVKRDASLWYDERTSTTVDPIIRGFAGFNLLALVDSNTLSTLWGEGGFGADDMYGKVEPETVERIEIIRGPTSALYGSNALGAVVNLITRTSPYDFTEAGFRWGGRSKLSTSSADAGWGFRQEFFGATPDFRFLVGGAARQFDDIRGGGELGLLVPSSGNEQNLDFSGEMRLARERILRLTLASVHREDIKRYYRPTQDNTNDRRAAALFYNDSADGAPWDELEARLYYQYKQDIRWFQATGPRGEATTETLTAGLRGTKDVGRGHVLTGGFALERDDGDSPDDEQFTMVTPPPKSRAAPLSTWSDAGVYAQDEWRVSKPLSLLGSARYDYMLFETDVDDAYDPPAGNPQDDDIREENGALTGGLGAVYRASEEVHLRGNWARGFRQNAPNFGLRQLGDGTLIPNGLLDPTTSDNFEAGVATRAKGLTFDACYYYSFVDNWQGDLRPVASYNGQTYYDWNGNGTEDANEAFVEQVEGGDASVQGVELHWTWQPNAHIGKVPAHWSIWGSFAWNRGRVSSTDAHPVTEPLRHTQPMRCIMALRWDDVQNPRRGLFAELVVDMVGKFDDIPSDRVNSDLAWRRDPQDGTSPLLRDYGGVPGYSVFNVHTGVNLSDSIVARLSVENLFNKKYRAAHSRMDAAGMNVIASLEVWF